ncbi:TPA: hypothetical protein ACIPE5_002104 [Salmonella enterica subsp. diarizonae serovar 61:r:-]
MSNIDKRALREEFRNMQDHYSDPADRERQDIYIAAEALLDENIQLQREKDAIEAVALALRDDMRQAREQLEEEEKQVEELTMWIKRLAHSLRNAKPNSKLYGAAMHYLSRKGLISVEDVLK